MILANPLQILWDFLTAHLEKMPIDTDNPKRSCFLLAYQCFISLIFVVILLVTLNLAIITAATGDAMLIFITFAVTWLIDQVKQFGTLAMIYLIVVRRFGYLQTNEKEFINATDREIKLEMAIPRLKHCCLRTLQN